LATRHETADEGNARQLVRLFPSQVPLAHRSPAAAASGPHARPPCGAPTTGVHVPTCPPTSHASHDPEQATSQHTPSAQCPLAHAASEAHVCASLRWPTQAPPEQKASLAQSAFVAHPDGHVAAAPPHTY